MVESKQPAQWAVLFVTFIFAAIAIFFRLFSRRITRAYFWWDDAFAIGCFVVAIVWVIIVCIWQTKGLGMHIEDVTWLSQDEALYWTKLLLYIAELFYAFALFFGKMSILSFYWRLFSVSNIKLPIQILMGCSIIWITIRTFLAIFHCIPVEAFWLTIPGSYCAIDDKKFFFGSILVHVVLDVCILALPIIQVRQLQLPKLQRLGIIAMFMFGIFICVAAVAIIVTSVNFNAAAIDLTWNITDIVIWATVEVNLVTVSACLPTVRPAFTYFFGRFLPASTLKSGSNSYGISNKYGRSQNLKSIKLNTMPKKEDESSSTYQLNDSVHGDSHSDFESHALDRQKGTRTVITGRQNERHSDEEIENPFAGNGIQVRSETVVQVSSGRRNSTIRVGSPDHENGSHMRTLDERSLP
ncbi:uncharacterized protein JN550_009707 [Neoarthrinium moseri]|uniref:uncharacterized protein n=1 Tax=Neoarthrinium moseri TaxID=1658444 RepID=UPI001FDC30DE|nr:uncharacterized protein JN550_009707 [Neoarthrinium moseri]KAI1863181.1 hypothetical protein JN550_009707 [Neoarthrinium moseri]